MPCYSTYLLHCIFVLHTPFPALGPSIPTLITIVCIIHITSSWIVLPVRQFCFSENTYTCFFRIYYFNSSSLFMSPPHPDALDFSNRVMKNVWKLPTSLDLCPFIFFRIEFSFFSLTEILFS